MSRTGIEASYISKRSLTIVCFFLLTSFVLTVAGNVVQETQPIVYTYKVSTCDVCMLRVNNIVNPFMNSHLNEAEWIVRDLATQPDYNNELLLFIGAEALAESEFPVVVFVLETWTVWVSGQEMSNSSLEEAWIQILSGENPSPNPGFQTNMVAAGFVLTTGLVTGINPCLIGVVLYIASTSLQIQNYESKGELRKRTLLRVSSLTAGVLATYLVVALFFQAIPMDLLHIIGILIAIALTFIGIFSIVSFWKPEIFFFQTPMWLRILMRNYTEKNKLYYDFFLGFAFATIKLPCHGGLYFLLLSMLQNNLVEGIIYIGLFNFGVILPLLLAAALAAIGLTEVSTLETLNVKGKNYVRLITGVVLLIAAGSIFVFG